MLYGVVYLIDDFTRTANRLRQTSAQLLSLSSAPTSGLISTSNHVCNEASDIFKPSVPLLFMSKKFTVIIREALETQSSHRPFRLSAESSSINGLLGFCLTVSFRYRVAAASMYIPSSIRPTYHAIEFKI